MKTLPLVALVASLAACTSATSPSEPAPPKTIAASAAASATATATASAAAPAPAAASASASAAAPAPDAADAGVDAEPLDAAVDAAAVPFVADNKILPPLASEELTARAKQLFEAIVTDDPAKGEAFWFPKEPFIPLKDVKGPDKYWAQLHRTYANDIHALHKKRKSWEGATFVGFEVGSKPKWVPPGDEANKIGYYRSFRGKLKYELEGKAYTIEVHTIINWQNQWFITHLSKFKKK